ncbi:MAG TPA: hypothetical protein VE343_02925, partial [Streptosporangiaceae bacterium]|nr:hypothetical protein [Streptosporangiaceae bacterium]
ANISLARYTKCAVRDAQNGHNNGWASINRSSLTRMVITRVVDAINGTVGSAKLLPVNLGSDSFKLLMGQYIG